MQDSTKALDAKPPELLGEALGGAGLRAKQDADDRLGRHAIRLLLRFCHAVADVAL